MENNLQPRAQARQITPEEVAELQARFLGRVYGWMAAGLGLTGGVALFASTWPALQALLAGNRLLFWGLIGAELALVSFLSARLLAWSRAQVQGGFIAYALLNGITLSGILLVYTHESLAATFFVSGATFGLMSLYGYFTRQDLSGWGRLLGMALLGLVLAMVANLFWPSSLLSLITSAVGVLLFVALTAYDTQKLKGLALLGVTEGEETSEKVAVLGALTLYLDFINLFLFLLRLFGRRR